MTEKHDVVALTAEIVAAYVGNNSVASDDIAELIGKVHRALVAVATGAVAGPVPERMDQKPAVPVKRSVHSDFIVCLEDGKKFKSLKRHLRTHYNLSPERYREKWGLPADYPMVAPKYAEARSVLAKKIGLGQRRGRG
jgi:predicted transcriptional regulator